MGRTAVLNLVFVLFCLSGLLALLARAAMREESRGRLVAHTSMAPHARRRSPHGGH
jgi:hypothetical protein